MDNSIKLLIGVVGLAGLIAFVVPSGAPTPETVVPPVSQATAAPQIIGLDPDLQATPDREPVQVEYFKFGEPTIDGKPFGSVEEQRPTENSRDEAAPPVVAVTPPQADMQNVLPAPPLADPTIPAI